jgi:hypothetical protein
MGALLGRQKNISSLSGLADVDYIPSYYPSSSGMLKELRDIGHLLTPLELKFFKIQYNYGSIVTPRENMRFDGTGLMRLRADDLVHEPGKPANHFVVRTQHIDKDQTENFSIHDLVLNSYSTPIIIKWGDKTIETTSNWQNRGDQVIKWADQHHEALASITRNPGSRVFYVNIDPPKPILFDDPKRLYNLDHEPTDHEIRLLEIAKKHGAAYIRPKGGGRKRMIYSVFRRWLNENPEKANDLMVIDGEQENHFYEAYPQVQPEPDPEPVPEVEVEPVKDDAKETPKTTGDKVNTKTSSQSDKASSPSSIPGWAWIGGGVLLIITLNR